MTYAKLLAASLLTGALAACAMAADATSAAPKNGAESAQPPGTGGNDANAKAGGLGAAPSAAGQPQASGLILVHAATFPAFRLCFEGALDQYPQPDSKIMPEANVVGVEVGSVVRIDPVRSPGKIYVMAESTVRSEATSTCRALLEGVNGGAPRIFLNTDYFEAGSIGPDLGTTSVQVLAITGCGNQTTLENFHLASAACAASGAKGTLDSRAVTLEPTTVRATAQTIPVQLLNVAPALQAQIGPGTHLDVTYGELTGTKALAQPVATGTTLLATSQQVTLKVDQTHESVYGKQGFRVAVRDNLGNATTTFDQSLFAVQDLSSPSDLPTTYYQAASNYVLLLLGDPAIDADAGGGGFNRRSLHLLAIPVVDPSQLPAADAGADGAAPDGGQL